MRPASNSARLISSKMSGSDSALQSYPLFEIILPISIDPVEPVFPDSSKDKRESCCLGTLNEHDLYSSRAVL